MNERCKFIEGKLYRGDFGNMSVIYEGKFLDTWQDKEIYLYANISDFDSDSLDESYLRIYPYPFFELVDAENWALTNMTFGDIVTIKYTLIEEYRKEIANPRAKHFNDLTNDI